MRKNRRERLEKPAETSNGNNQKKTETSMQELPTIVRSGRQTVKGPEDRLVTSFLPQFIAQFQLPSDCCLTIFQEPRLASGLPDLVAVVWNRHVVNRWPSSIGTVRPDDLRIAHLLVTQGAQSETQLRGFGFHSPTASLRRLEASETIRLQNNRWNIAPLDDCFAVRKIVSIEAKVGAWKSVLDQALANQWFASESCVLIPDSLYSEDRRKEAGRWGIGVWVQGESKPEQRSEPNLTSQPLSYASWLFNHWIGIVSRCNSASKFPGGKTNA
jgi:hypothetical protein